MCCSALVGVFSPSVSGCFAVYENALALVLVASKLVHVHAVHNEMADEWGCPRQERGRQMVWAPRPPTTMGTTGTTSGLCATLGSIPSCSTYEIRGFL